MEKVGPTEGCLKRRLANFQYLEHLRTSQDLAVFTHTLPFLVLNLAIAAQTFAQCDPTALQLL